MTYRRRADKNHSQITAALRKIGARVYDASRVGGGFPDLVVANYTLYKDPLIPSDPGTFKFDWVPDQGMGHGTYTIDNSWEGTPPRSASRAHQLEMTTGEPIRENPFR